MKRMLIAVGLWGIMCASYGAQSWVSTNSELTIKFASTRISTTKSTYYDYLQGKITASLKTSKKYFKRPLLRVVVITEENGSRVVRDSVMAEPNLKVVGDFEDCGWWWSENWVTKTTTMTEDGWYLDALAVGKNIRDRRCRTIEELSNDQTEVNKAQFSNMIYLGLPIDVQERKGLKGFRRQTMFGYCRFGENENAKMIGYRLEFWHEGKCISYWDSLKPSDLDRNGLPDDWHVSFKYPDKFKYRTPWASKKVVRQ